MKSERPTHISERYAAHAPAYRVHWAPLLRVAGRELASEFLDLDPHRILDVGSGVGTLLPDLEELFPSAQIVGLDRTFGMIRLAPAHFGRSVVDAATLPIRGESADLTLYVFMLFHLSDPIDALRESRRVLRDGGRVGTLTWAADSPPRPVEDIWIDCLDNAAADEVDPALRSRHELVDTPEIMEGLLKAAGFQSVRIRVGDLIHRMDLESFLALKTSMGSMKGRFDSLSDERQSECVAEARRRLAKLDADAWIEHNAVIYASGTRND